MKPIKTQLLDDVFRESELFDIYQTARKLIIMESSLNSRLNEGDVLDSGLYKRFFDLCQSDINLHLLPVFCREYLKYCLDAETPQITQDDYPLNKILEYCQQHGSFSPVADKPNLDDLYFNHVDLITKFCKVIAFRGFAFWDDSNQVLTMEKPPADPENYDYQWLYL